MNDVSVRMKKMKRSNEYYERWVYLAGTMAIDFHQNEALSIEKF